jgi:hypothetical protein
MPPAQNRVKPNNELIKAMDDAAARFMSSRSCSVQPDSANA